MWRHEAQIHKGVSGVYVRRNNALDGSSGVAYDIIATPGYGIESIFAPALQFPEKVAVSPSGVIVVFEHCTEDTGQCIVWVHEDGTLSTYGDVIPKCYRAIAFDASSNLYAVDHDGALYKTSPEGETTQVATGVAVGDLAAGPSGDISSPGMRKSLGLDGGCARDD